MSVYAKDFTYNNKSLSSFGDYIMVSFDDDDTELPIFSRNLNTGDWQQDRITLSHYGTTPSEVYPLEFSICKQDESEFTKEESEKLISWLGSPQFPETLRFISEGGKDNFSGINYIGLFESASYFEYGGRKCGMTFSFKCNSPYGFSDEQTVSYSPASGATGTCKVVVSNTIQNHPVYPILEVTGHVAETITITNKSKANSKPFTLDTVKDMKITVADFNLFDSSENLYSLSKCNLEFPKLINGSNTIEIKGNCDVKIRWRNTKALGR